jgi:hypothetical protein
MNVGVLCRTSPTVDIDVTDPDVAAEIEAMVFDVVGEKCGVKFGRAPKRAIIFRTEKSFAKMATPFFTAPNGDACRIEILANGQQTIVFGTHPDTHEPYRWHGELGAHADLPVLTAETARVIVDKSTDIMRAKGWPETGKQNSDAIASAPAATAQFDAMYGGATRQSSYANAALAGSASELAAMGKDTGRNDALNAISYRLGRMITRGWIERSHVEAELFKACTINGLVREDGAKSVRKTMASGIGDGLTVPHDDLDAPKVEAPSIVPKMAQPAQSLRLTYFSECDNLELKQWLQKGIIALGDTSGWVGPPKTGKCCGSLRRRQAVAQPSLQGALRRCDLRAGTQGAIPAPAEGLSEARRIREPADRGLRRHAGSGQPELHRHHRGDDGRGSREVRRAGPHDCHRYRGQGHRDRRRR